MLENSNRDVQVVKYPQLYRRNALHISNMILRHIKTQSRKTDQTNRFCTQVPPSRLQKNYVITVQPYTI